MKSKQEQQERAKIAGQYQAAVITKVKIGDNILIQWDVNDTDMRGSVELPLTGEHSAKNEPTPEFRNSLNELAASVCEICEWPASEAPTVKIHGISLSYHGEEKEKVLNAVITVTKALLKTKASILVNTPNLPESVPAKSGRTTLPAAASAQIGIIIDEARKYLSGVRSQQEFPLSSDKDSDSGFLNYLEGGKNGKGKK